MYKKLYGYPIRPPIPAGQHRIEPVSTRKNDHKLIHISDILKTALKKYRPAGDTDMTRIWDVWDTAVGRPIAMNAKPDTFKDGVLIVNVSSSSWIHQLKFLEKQIISNINQHMASSPIRQIRFKIGNIHS
jgi:predicted nucleic acid-binding Zn ribbon protein